MLFNVILMFREAELCSKMQMFVFHHHRHRCSLAPPVWVSDHDKKPVTPADARSAAGHRGTAAMYCIYTDFLFFSSVLINTRIQTNNTKLGMNW